MRDEQRVDQDAPLLPPAGPRAQRTFYAVAVEDLPRHAGQVFGFLPGVRRLSIIGCDRFTAGYNAAKLAHEQAMLSGPIPVRVLRAAQFHEFVGQLVDWGWQDDVSYVPEMRTQLVAARTVAEALVDLATVPDGTVGRQIPEIAGPREESLVAMARLLVARRGNHLRIEPVSDPADPDSELYATGGLLPSAHATLAGPTFEQWLHSTEASE